MKQRDDTRELPQRRDVHKRVTYETDSSEPEPAPSIGPGKGDVETIDGAGGVRAGREGNEPVDDATEVLGWCERCDEERRFLKENVPVPVPEGDDEAPPLVRTALEGETGWVCEACGNFRRDPVAEGAYDFEYSNVGYHVKQFPEEPQTVRETATRGVEEDERVIDHGTLRNPAEARRGRPGEAGERDLE